MSRATLGELSRTPLVRGEDGSGRPERPVTAVFLHGEHDFACCDLLDDALAPVLNDTLVDLSWCTYADSAIIAKHAALQRAGLHLEVILPPTHTQLSRMFDRLGARKLLPVRAAPPPCRTC